MTYKLSTKQRQLLLATYGSAGVFCPTGGEVRSARALRNLGLATYDDIHLYLTVDGRELAKRLCRDRQTI